jgi:hypothetical protein
MGRALVTLGLTVALLLVIYLWIVGWMRWVLDRDDRESGARQMQERIDAIRRQRERV